MAQLNIRFEDPKLHSALKKRADAEGISLNKLAIEALQKFMNTPSSSPVTQAELDQRLAPIERELAKLREVIHRSDRHQP